jgi:hypothetical protein
LTDGNPMFDPRLYGASEHRASPECEHSDMGGGDDPIGKGSGCPGTFVKDVICGIPRTASLCSKNVGGPFGSTTRDRCVDTQQGGEICVASAGIGLELDRTCKPLFLKKTEASTKFSCNI